MSVTPQSSGLHLPMIHINQIKSSFSNPKLSIRSSLIPKRELLDTFDEFHKQRITNLSKDSHSGFAKDAKKLLKSPKKNELIQDLTSLYSLNERDLFELALETLQKPVEHREDFDLKVITLSTENVKFFQEYGQQTHNECCRYMFWEHGKAQSTLFEMGSVGTKFYIILKGTVGIWVNLPKIVLDENGKTLEQKEFVMTEVKVLGPGSSFGELALLDNRPRAATIKCKENCEFAVLDKKHFNDILKDKEQKKLYENVDFLANMRVFKGFSFASLKSLFYNTFEIKTLRKQVIYRKGDDPHSVYIIREGEFLMNVEVEIAIESLNSEKGGGLKKDRITKTMDLAILGPGHIFGEEEIFEKIKRNTTVTCVSHSASLYVLAKKEFYRRVFLEDGSRVFLKENLKIKKKFRNDRIQEFLETEKFFSIPKGQDLLTIDSKYEENNEKEEKQQEVSNTPARIALKKTLLEEMQKTFVLSEAVKASAYERYKAVKAKYPTKEISINMQEILKKKMLDETLMTPYLKAFLKEKTGNIDLKRKLEFKEDKRKFALFFQEKSKEEKLKPSNNDSVFSNVNEEMKPNTYDSLILSEINKEEGKKRDPFKKLKSFSMHEKGKDKERIGGKMFPLKYQVKEIIKRKVRRFIPVTQGHVRGFSL